MRAIREQWDENMIGQREEKKRKDSTYDLQNDADEYILKQFSTFYNQKI